MEICDVLMPPLLAPVTPVQHLPLPSTIAADAQSTSDSLPWPAAFPITPPHVTASVAPTSALPAPQVTSYTDFSPSVLRSWSLPAHLLQGFVAAFQATSAANANANPETPSINLAELGASTLSFGSQETVLGVASSQSGANATPISPSVGRQIDDHLCTRDFLCLLGLMLGPSVTLLRNAVLSHAAASSVLAKSRWLLVEDIFFIVVILVIGATQVKLPSRLSPTDHPLRHKTLKTIDAPNGGNG